MIAFSPKITLIAAASLNRVIGRDGALPWRLKSDMASFRAATRGKNVVMGRRTFESLPGLLKGRRVIVLSWGVNNKTARYHPAGRTAGLAELLVVRNLEELERATRGTTALYKQHYLGEIVGLFKDRHDHRHTMDCSSKPGARITRVTDRRSGHPEEDKARLFRGGLQGRSRLPCSFNSDISHCAEQGRARTAVCRDTRRKPRREHEEEDPPCTRR